MSRSPTWSIWPSQVERQQQLTRSKKYISQRLGINQPTLLTVKCTSLVGLNLCDAVPALLISPQRTICQEYMHEMITTQRSCHGILITV